MVQGQDRRKALEQALLEERAAKASLDLQVRALCAELTRASDTTGARGRFAWQAMLAFAIHLGHHGKLRQQLYLICCWVMETSAWQPFACDWCLT